MPIPAFDFREPLPVLLAADRHGGGLSLTIDLDPTSTQPERETILELTAALPAATAHPAVDLASFVDAVVEWEDDSGVGGRGALTLRFDYTRLDAARRPADAAALHARVRRLARLLAGAEERYWQADRRHGTLRERLGHEVTTETDRARRKLPFLREQGSRGAEREEGRLAALARIEALLTSSDEAPNS